MYKSILIIISLLVASKAWTQNQNNWQKIDSLKHISLDKSASDTTVVNSYLELAGCYYLQQPDSAIYFAHKAQLLSKQINYLLGESESNGWLGYLYDSQGESSRALEHHIKSIEATSKIGDFNTVAKGINNIGVTFDNRGEIIRALNCYYQSLDIYLALNDYNGVAMTLANIGNIYRRQRDFKNAVTFYQRAMKSRDMIPERNRDEDYYRLRGETFNNIGSTYMRMEEFQSANEYMRKGIRLSLKIQDRASLDTKYLNLGTLQYKLAENLNKEFHQSSYDSLLSQATIYLDSGSYYAQLTGDKKTHSNLLISKGKVEFLKNNMDSAMALTKKGLELAETAHYPDNVQYATELLYLIYDRKGEYNAALRMHERFIQVRDSLANSKIQSIAIGEWNRFEYEMRKEVDEAKHQQKLFVEKEEKKKQTIITAATAIVLVLVLIFLIFVFNRLKITRKQKALIETQKQEVETAKAEVEEAHKEITDSIEYAQRIQSAILPPNRLVEELLPNSFILYRPKDVVAGDFYWLEKKDDAVLFAAADCTGHGVPGAMVSVICNGALNRSVREYGLKKPGQILDQARKIVIKEFEKSEDEVKDGMDIALCSLNGKTLKYAGAHNPLWIVRNGEILETKADKQPIGKFDQMSPFTTHEVELESGDSIYIFSDGYVDQFGGEKGKKFKAKKFRELLLSIQISGIEDQKELIEKAFLDWKGSHEQIDDVCVIGVQIS